VSATPQTVKAVLETAAGYLQDKPVDHPRLACELLLARLLQCKRLELYLRFDQPLTAPQLEAMRRGTRRLAAGEPAQYILGRTEFMGHGLKVDPRALIPRPETEQLVEQVLQCEALWDGRPDGEGMLAVDVGTGSGCIAISLARARTALRCVATDPSTEAVALARENAAAREVADRLAVTNAELSDCVEPESVDVIVANLPYVPTPEWERLPVHIRDHEPRAALDGGPDGLDVIRQLVPDAAIALKPGGFLFLEIGAPQGPAVNELLAAEGFTDITLTPDHAGHDRIASARVPA
jgi:release factor glutamine methyltransferase